MSNDFEHERATRLQAYAADTELQDSARAFFLASVRARYSYNFDWLSRPIIQYPQDMVAMQEIIWRVRPDLIIETGIARGGSLVMSASMLALLDYCDAAQTGTTLDPRNPKRKVLGIDIDIRTHNRAAIEAHPLAPHIEMIEGSSVDTAVIAQVQDRARGISRVLVCLDSNHTHEHVLRELEAYAPLTTPGSYCCVFDTAVEDIPDAAFADRPWGQGDNPKTAVHAYLQMLAGAGRLAKDGGPLRLEVDTEIERKLQITVAPGGYLYRPAQ